MSETSPISSTALVERFRDIHEKRMQDLPFINAQIRVEAIGFRSFENFEIGVLITPWFMNLMLLPNAVSADLDQGHKVNVSFPSGAIEFTTALDDELGLYFSAVLFSSVMSIPDQATAVDLANEVMKELFESEDKSKNLSRRSLFTTIAHADA